MFLVRHFLIISLGVVTVLSETWIFEIKTRKQRYAGTDSKIEMAVNGSTKTQVFELKGKFESGSLDVNSFETSFGRPLEITLHHHGDGPQPSWKFDYLTMWKKSNEADKHTINCNCWLNGNKETFTVTHQPLAATSTNVESLYTTSTQERKTTTAATSTTKPNAETSAALTLTTRMMKTTDKTKSPTGASSMTTMVNMLTGDPGITPPDATAPTQLSQRFCFLACQENQTMEELMTLVNKLKAELKVEKKVTNSYLRSKTSATDKRPSSAAIGYIAVIILTTVGLGILALDLPRLIQSARLIRRKFKKSIHASN